MIDTTLTFLLDQLNQHLSSRFPAPAQHAVIGRIGVSGTAAQDLTNKMVLTLINVEREGIAANTSKQFSVRDDTTTRVSQPLNINLVFLVAANFDDDYKDGLKILSAVIDFFQAHPLFLSQTTPDMPDTLERISVEWSDMDLQATHNLWTVLGGSYLPSVAYKARMIVVEDAWTRGETPIITGTQVSSSS